MVGSLVLTLALHGGPIGSDALDQSGAEIVTKMFARYFEAERLVGTVVQTTSDTAGSITVTSQVGYERPSKIYVSQDRKSLNGLNLLLVSDGNKFRYDPPRNAPIPPKPGERFEELAQGFEPATRRAFYLTIGEIYAVGHSSLMPSTALDIAIAHQPHLRDFSNSVATVTLMGMVQHKGQEAYRLVGQWRHNKEDLPERTTGMYASRYELVVSKEYDLLKFTLEEPYSVGGQRVVVTQTEVADLKIGAVADEERFRVR